MFDFPLPRSHGYRTKANFVTTWFLSFMMSHAVGGCLMQASSAEATWLFWLWMTGSRLCLDSRCTSLTPPYLILLGLAGQTSFCWPSTGICSATEHYVPSAWLPPHYHHPVSPGWDPLSCVEGPGTREGFLARTYSRYQWVDLQRFTCFFHLAKDTKLPVSCWGWLGLFGRLTCPTGQIYVPGSYSRQKEPNTVLVRKCCISDNILQIYVTYTICDKGRPTSSTMITTSIMPVSTTNYHQHYWAHHSRVQ